MSLFLDDGSATRHPSDINLNDQNYLHNMSVSSPRVNNNQTNNDDDQYETFLSSRISSPFISNPEMLKDFNHSYSDNGSLNNSLDQSFDRSLNDPSSSHIDAADTLHIDKSIASLEKSIADIKLTKASSRSFHDSTFDTSKFNETRAQFDKDIDLDNNSPSVSRFSNGNSSRSRVSPISGTPWRQLRSSSSFIPYNLPTTKPTLNFDSPNINLNNHTSQDANMVNKVNDLNKQLTGYKIQIRFFKLFLQSLIEKSKDNNNVLDVSELAQIQNRFSGLSPSGKGTSSTNASDYNKLELEFKELAKNYDEIYKLNEDLYLSLEEFQNKIHEKDVNISELNKSFYNFNELINDIMYILINDVNTEAISKQALKKCLENCADGSLEIKLQVIKMELNKKLDSRRTSFTSSTSTKVPDKERQDELNNYIKIIHSLIATVEQIKFEYNEQRGLNDKIKQDLDFEINQSEQLNSKYNLITRQFDSLMTATGNDKKDLEFLRQENEKLVSINSTINEKFENYQQMIDHLRKEVNNLKNSADNNLNLTELNEELLQSHKDFNSLQEEYNELNSQYMKLKQDSSDTVSSLTNQLHSKQNESSTMKADRMVMEKMEQELNLAVEKQRILKAEKIRLSYKVDSLTKDKISLQTTIQNLTDKITTLTVHDSGSRNEDSESSLIKRLNILEYQAGEILQTDVVKFQKLLKSFNKIADDISLKEPTRKIDYLTKKIAPNNSSHESVSTNTSQNSATNNNSFVIDLTDVNVKEFHKSIFDYFTRAVDIIVNDHVKLLLNESDSSNKTNEYITKLHKRIDQLSAINDNMSEPLTEDLHETTSNNNTSTASPLSKLRIDELTNRLKQERERRVYENQEATKRLKELEFENLRLKDQISEIND